MTIGMEQDVALNAISADANVLVAPDPPAISTLPFASSVLVWPARAVINDPPELHVPCAWSKSSVEAWVTPAGVNPPAVSTVPSPSTVSGAQERAAVSEPVADQVPVPGL